MVSNKSFLDEIEKIESSIEDMGKPVSEMSRYEAADLARELRWRQKRAGKITSSVASKLIKRGQKGAKWGKESSRIIYDVLHERLTGEIRDTTTYKDMEWGNTYEAEGIQYYSRTKGIDVIDCARDLEDIVFLDEKVKGYGDSPDAMSKDGKIIAEIKCPAAGGIHMSYCSIKKIDKSFDYFWQLIGHFMASDADVVDFVSYDPRIPEGHPNKIHIVSMSRDDYVEHIDQLKERVEDAVSLIDDIEKTNDVSLIHKKDEKSDI